MTLYRSAFLAVVFIGLPLSTAQNFQWSDVIQNIDIQSNGVIKVHDERTLKTDGDFGEVFLCLTDNQGTTISLEKGGALSPGPKVEAFQQPCEGGQELVVRQQRRTSERRVYFDYKISGAIELYSDVAFWDWALFGEGDPPAEGYRLTLTTPGPAQLPYRLLVNLGDRNLEGKVSDDGRETSYRVKRISSGQTISILSLMNPNQFTAKGTEPALDAMLYGTTTISSTGEILTTTVSGTAPVNEIIDSSGPLEGALQSIADTVVGQYLPGYGFQINSFYIGPDWADESLVPTLEGVVSGLSPTILGLEDGDWVSVGMTRTGFGMQERRIYLVRVKPGQNDTLETYIDGERQR